MSSIVPPAASTEALRLSQTWRVCASISPIPAIVPSARRATIPEMKTSRPRASIIVACEKTPLGWGRLSERICCLGIGRFSRGARQHRAAPSGGFQALDAAASARDGALEPQGSKMTTEKPAPRSLPTRLEDRLIVALDLPSVDAARGIVARLDGIVSFYKVGLWLIFAPGFEAFLDDLRKSGCNVFLDAKMFDIGETVRRGIERVAERGVSFVTIHGDGDIIRAAVDGRGNSALKLLVVPALTSLDERGLRELGHSGTVADLIADRARFALDCGVDGIIASPQDNPNAIRRRLDAERLLVVTPGVRLAGAALDDHKRSGTPAQAIADGADYLVVGRPIVQADDPADMAARVIADMKSCLQRRETRLLSTRRQRANRSSP